METFETMNRELQNWCDRNAHELSTPEERNPDMSMDEYDRAISRRLWHRRAKAASIFLFNPLTALVAAFGTVALLFKLLGWSE